MKNNNTRKTVVNRKTSKRNKKITSNSREINKSSKIKNRKRKLKPMMIVNYTFLISLLLSIIFGMQTNMIFLVPFTIVLVITIVCMGIILVNAIYTKIKKTINKTKKDI